LSPNAKKPATIRLKMRMAQGFSTPQELSFAAASPDQKTTMMIRSMAYNI
jgi:hypothetical protein